MKPKLQFDFLVDMKKNTMMIRREYAARRQLVWDCHTKSELLDQWFAPKPLTTKTKSMDFRDGGHWHYVMIDPNGPEYWGRMDYKKIRPIENYTALDGFSDASGAVNPDLPRSEWNVTFSDQETRTLVENVVSYQSAEALQKAIDMGMKQGMTSTLERLDELLAVLSTRSA
jgi:uncharacterized protein YndB with AHSA1/START domain